MRGFEILGLQCTAVPLWDPCDKEQRWAERHFPHPPGNQHSFSSVRTRRFGILERQQPSMNISIFWMVPSTKPSFIASEAVQAVDLSKGLLERKGEIIAEGVWLVSLSGP